MVKLNSEQLGSLIFQWFMLGLITGLIIGAMAAIAVVYQS